MGLGFSYGSRVSPVRLDRRVGRSRRKGKEKGKAPDDFNNLRDFNQQGRLAVQVRLFPDTTFFSPSNNAPSRPCHVLDCIPIECTTFTYRTCSLGVIWLLCLV